MTRPQLREASSRALKSDKAFSSRLPCPEKRSETQLTLAARGVIYCQMRHVTARIL